MFKDVTRHLCRKKIRDKSRVTIILFLLIYFYSQSIFPLFKQNPIRCNIEFTDNTKVNNCVFFSQKLGAKLSYFIESASEPIRKTAINPFDINNISFVESVFLTFSSGEDDYIFSIGSKDQINVPDQWYSKDVDAIKWNKPKRVTGVYKDWIYIPKADWVWTESNPIKSAGESVIYYRPFTIPNEVQILDATLTVYVDEYLKALYINETPLITDNTLTCNNKPLNWNIKYLILNGKNSIAMKVMNSEKVVLNPSCVSFRIDISGIKKVVGNAYMRSPIRYIPELTVIIDNQDIVSGELEYITPLFIGLRTSFGHIRVNRDWVSLGYSSIKEAKVPERKYYEKAFYDIIKSPKKEKGESFIKEPIFWQIDNREGLENFTGIVTKDKKKHRGDIMELQENAILIRERHQKPSLIPMENIATLYFNPKPDTVIDYYTNIKDPLVRVLMNNGDVVTGLLLNMSKKTLLITTPYSDRIALAKDKIVEIDFLRNKMLKMKEDIQKISPKEITIGVLPPHSMDVKEIWFDNVNNMIEEVCNNLDFKFVRLSPEQIVDKEFFNPEKIDIVFATNNRDYFYNSIHKDGDGQEAILNYFKNGGKIVIIGTDIPFSYGLNQTPAGLEKVFLGSKLMDEMGLKIISNAVAPTEDGISFEIPPNGSALKFELNKELTDIKILPEEIEFPVLSDQLFRPIVDDKPLTNRVFRSIYTLRDKNNKNFGNAFCIINYNKEDYNNAKVAYISQPLAYAFLGKSPSDKNILYELFKFIIE